MSDDTLKWFFVVLGACVIVGAAATVGVERARAEVEIARIQARLPADGGAP